MVGRTAGTFGLRSIFVAGEFGCDFTFLATMLYVYLGIAQHHFSQRLFSRTVWEYVTIGTVVLVTMLITANM